MNDAVTLTKANLSEILRPAPRFARLGASLLLTLVEKGSLTVSTPEGVVFKVRGAQPGPHADLHVRNWRFLRRVLMSGDVGVGESFIDGDWSSSDVTCFLEVFCVNVDATLRHVAAHPFYRFVSNLRHWINRNTRRGSKRNIAAHYDLGNAFYETWLDPSMTYSSALFEDGANSLEAAQLQKYRSLARLCDLQPGNEVLEIGCGWGGFAEYAAREHGARVTGLTISRAQFDYARARIARAGLEDRVDIRFEDYRDHQGRYDRIASVEMFEAVGERYWPVFFEKMTELLEPNGAAGLQIITVDDEIFEEYRRAPDFI